MLPILKVGNVKMGVEEKITYLGVVFNTKGNNKDLVEDRMQKGRTCMINLVAMCSVITLGTHALKSLLLVYKTTFVPTLLYGSQVWTNVTQEEIKKLKVVQLHFLKRILQAPSFTCNCITFLELGILPVEYEIHLLCTRTLEGTIKLNLKLETPW